MSVILKIKHINGFEHNSVKSVLEGANESWVKLF